METPATYEGIINLVRLLKGVESTPRKSGETDNPVNPVSRGEREV